MTAFESERWIRLEFALARPRLSHRLALSMSYLNRVGCVDMVSLTKVFGLWRVDSRVTVVDERCGP